MRCFLIHLSGIIPALWDEHHRLQLSKSLILHLFHKIVCDMYHVMACGLGHAFYSALAIQPRYVACSKPLVNAMDAKEPPLNVLG